MKSTEQEESLGVRINKNLADNWKLYTVLFASLIVVIAAILVIGFVNKNNTIASSELAEDIQQAYESWMSAPDDQKSTDELDSLISEAIKKYPSKFAAQRAYFTRGLVAMENEDWETAVDSFSVLAEKWPESYLAPVSLFNAAAASEEKGDIDSSMTYLIQLKDKYSDSSPYAPEALFNLGRLSEKKGDKDKAVEYYKSVGSTFPQSRWTNLSKSRILVLENRS